MNQIIEFLGKLAEVQSHCELALKKIATLWEDGSIRLKEDDLILMRKTLKEIKKTLKKVEKFNHDKFSKITNEAVEQIIN